MHLTSKIQLMVETVSYKILFENKFLVVKFFPEFSLLMLDWKSATANMGLDEFNQTVSQLPPLLKELKPRRFFNNLSDFEFVVSMDAHDKPRQVLSILENMPEFEKEAYVLPKKNLEAHMAIHVLLDTIKPKYVYDIFIDENDAFEWLKS